MYLIGNKSDLNKNIEQGLIDELLKEFKYEYKETSAAKDHKELENLFQNIGEKLYEMLGDGSDKQQKNLKIKKKNNFL